MAKKIIHVAQDAIRRNMKNGTNDPAIIIRRGGKATRHHEVEILDDRNKVVARIVYSPHKPLSCGARVWIEVPGLVAVPVDDPNQPADAVTVETWHKKGEFSAPIAV